MIDIDPTIEKMARAIISSQRGDPDTLVQLGAPRVFGTPGGDAFSVAPGAELPLWRLYIDIAREMLELARKIEAERQAA